MKFSNGCWLQKEGVGCLSPVEVYDTAVEEKKVLLFAPTRHIETRGDALDGVCLTIEITSPMPEIIRVRTLHHKGAAANGPAFEINDQENCTLDVEDKEDHLCIHSGKAGLFIDKKEWKMTYLNGKEKRCSSGKSDLAYMKTNWNGPAYALTNEDAYMRQQLSLGVGELVYGLGERFTAFVKNGQSVDIWNEDGGTSTEQSYKNIPFYISNKGYGVFVNHPEKVSFEIATEAVTKVEFSVPGESLDYFFINGPGMKDVLRRYTDLTGKPGLPAPWTFGLWLSTSFTTNYDEKTVMSFIDGMLDRGIPLKVFHFDCFWMKAFHWSNFTWDSKVFPDPKGMLSRIKAKGLHICVWINPYIAQRSVMFEEGLQKGYFLKRKDGSVWQWDMWQPGMAIVDFTNPEAKKWYQDKLKALLDMGVDCFKTDFGERIPVEDVVYSNGMAPQKMHNYYTYLYNQAVYELLEEQRGKGEAVLFARSATVGGQKFPVHWGGDCWSDYESMEESLRGGLSLQMSGFGFWSHDIGGFEQTSTADVYKRWCAFGLLSSHSRLHGSGSYRVPWLYDEEAVDVLRFFAKLKAKLMPYFWKTAICAHREGIPVMRALVLEFTDDRNTHYIDKQYMLGDNLLVAPIFRKDGMGAYYLPVVDGVWTNFFTGEMKQGGRWYEEKFDYCEIPLFVKPNSVIAVGSVDDGPEYDYGDGVTMRVFGLNGKAEASVYTMDQELALHITAENIGNEVHIHMENHNGKNPTVELVNADAAVIQGAKMDKRGNSLFLTELENDMVVNLANKYVCEY